MITFLLRILTCSLIPFFFLEAIDESSQMEKVFKQIDLLNETDALSFLSLDLSLDEGYVWFLKGILQLHQSNHTETNRQLMQQTSRCFNKAYHLIPIDDSVGRGCAGLFYAQQLLKMGTEENFLKAIEILETITKSKQLLEVHHCPHELLYTLGWAYAKLWIFTNDSSYFHQAEKVLQQSIKLYGTISPKYEASFLLGTIYYMNDMMSLAKKQFLKIVEENPSVEIGAKALYWGALSEASQKEKQHLFQHLIDQFPESQFAAEAYFQRYPIEEYYQGKKETLVYLEQMPERYPNHFLSLYAHFFLGYNACRNNCLDSADRSRNTYLPAIENFKNMDKLYEKLHSTDQIPHDHLNNLSTLRNLAKLEIVRLHVNRTENAEPSTKYASMQLAICELETITNDLSKREVQLTTQCDALYEEAMYDLTKIYFDSGNEEKALSSLQKMLSMYASLQITKGYFLSRFLYLKGQWALKQQNPEDALDFFLNSEEAASLKFGSSDEKLDLWIQQALCYRDKNDLDQAMILLSKVVNDYSTSSLRLKAMYYRSTIYGLQERFELERNQLTSLSGKEGEWAKLAEKTLREKYATH